MIMPSTWRRDEPVDMDTGEELGDVDGDALGEMERRLGQSPLPDHTPRLSREYVPFPKTPTCILYCLSF